MTSAKKHLAHARRIVWPSKNRKRQHRLVHRRKGAIADSHEAAMAGGPHRSEGLDEIAQDATFHGADLEASILMTNWMQRALPENRPFAGFVSEVTGPRMVISSAWRVNLVAMLMKRGATDFLLTLKIQINIIQLFS